MKKIKVLFLSLALLLIFSGAALAESVNVSSQGLIVKPIFPTTIDPTAKSYNIDGENYFSIRALQFSFSSSSFKYMSVKYNKDKDVITVEKPGEDISYSMEDRFINDPLNKDPQVVKKDIKLNINSKDFVLKGYNIDGRNYVRLKDFAEAMDFSLSYDYINKLIVVDLEKPYKAESELDFKALHEKEYRDLRALIDSHVEGLESESTGFIKAFKPKMDLTSYKTYRDKLLQVKKDFSRESLLKENDLSTDFSYYIYIYRDLENLSYDANELVYNIDVFKDNGDILSIYTKDYANSFLKTLKELKEHLEPYDNYYK